MLTRRAFFSLAGGAAVVAASRGSLLASGTSPGERQAAGPITLPALPYPAAALEPYVDAQTMTIHHDRHHQAYVNGINVALAKHPAVASRSLDDLVRDMNGVPDDIRTAVRNHGGGHLNHVQFWTLMAPSAGGPPTGAAAAAITGAFGSFEKFKELFGQAAAGRFGSGWAWLSEDNGALVVHSTANQDSPLMEGRRPIFGLDVWEHAYYLKYQNRRGDYVSAFWNVINWAEVNRRLSAR